MLYVIVFFLCLIVLLLYCNSSHYMHMHLPFFFTLSLEVLTPWICISRSMYILSCRSCIWRGSNTLRGAGVPLLDHPFLVFSCFLIPITFIILYIGLSVCSVPLFLCYHCVRNLYVILQWLSCHHS